MFQEPQQQQTRIPCPFVRYYDYDYEWIFYSPSSSPLGSGFVGGWSGISAPIARRVYLLCLYVAVSRIYLPTYIYIFRRKVNSERVAPGHPLLTSVRCIEWWMVSVERREAFSALSQPSGFWWTWPPCRSLNRNNGGSSVTYWRFNSILSNLESFAGASGGWV